MVVTVIDSEPDLLPPPAVTVAKLFNLFAVSFALLQNSGWEELRPIELARGFNEIMHIKWSAPLPPELS